VGEVAGTDDIAGIAFAGADDRAVLDEIRRKGAIEVAGERYPVIVNGVWVMGIDAEHPQWRAIAAAFRSF
jgi:hypothetical protein